MPINNQDLHLYQHNNKQELFTKRKEKKVRKLRERAFQESKKNRVVVF